MRSLPVVCWNARWWAWNNGGGGIWKDLFLSWGWEWDARGMEARQTRLLPLALALLPWPEYSRKPSRFRLNRMWHEKHSRVSPAERVCHWRQRTTHSAFAMLPFQSLDSRTNLAVAVLCNWQKLLSWHSRTTWCVTDLVRILHRGGQCAVGQNSQALATN
jgi:hypothetical protein